MSEIQTNYHESSFLVNESTNPEGEFIIEVAAAIFKRERAVDAAVEGSGFLCSETLVDNDYYTKAFRVRQLQRKHGIYPTGFPLESDQ